MDREQQPKSPAVLTRPLRSSSCGWAGALEPWVAPWELLQPPSPRQTQNLEPIALQNSESLLPREASEAAPGPSPAGQVAGLQTAPLLMPCGLGAGAARAAAVASGQALSSRGGCRQRPWCQRGPSPSSRSPAPMWAETSGLVVRPHFPPGHHSLANWPDSTRAT